MAWPPAPWSLSRGRFFLGLGLRGGARVTRRCRAHRSSPAPTCGAALPARENPAPTKQPDEASTMSRLHSLTTVATVLAAFAVVSGCGGGGGSDSMPIGGHAPDIDAPTITLTAPAALASGLTGTIAISANASDNVGVTSVEFQIDGVAIGAADTSAPYATSLDTSAYPSGQHVVRARASDAA